MTEFNFNELQECGKDVFISSNVEIRRPHLVTIGRHVAIDSGFYLTTQAEIGSYVHIGPYVTCIGGELGKLTVGNFSTIAAGARIICLGEEHLGWGLVGPKIPKMYSDRKIGGEVILQDYVSIGTSAIVFPGVTMKEGSVLGAGSVLTMDAQPWTIYVGNPAKPLKPRYGEKMKEFGKALLEQES
jgi:acetyltransferase-like isoleucine patch superfamily enzyme